MILSTDTEKTKLKKFNTNSLLKLSANQNKKELPQLAETVPTFQQ